MARIDHLHSDPAKEAGKVTVVVPSQPVGTGEGRPPTEPAGNPDPLALEARTRQIGQQLLAAARERSASVLSSRFWSNRLLTWAMSDPGFKVQLFRFVDAFPMLQTPAEVYQCLVEYLDRPDVKLPASPRRVAADACRAIRWRRGTIYTPWYWRPIMAVIRAIPEPIFKRMKL